MVKLRRIRIENFTILKEIMGKDSLEINFTDNPICIIIGKNGSGKSFLMGTLSPTSFDLIKNRSGNPAIPDKIGLKELDLELDGKYLYKIKIVYDSKTSCFIHKYNRYTNEDLGELNPNGNVNTYYDVLDRELGFTKSYINIGYLSESITNLIDMKPAERSSYISIWLPQLSDFIDSYKIVSKKSNIIKRQIDLLNNDIGKLSDTDYDTLINNYDKSLIELENKYHTLIKNQSKTQTYLKILKPITRDELNKQIYDFKNKVKILNQERQEILDVNSLLSKYSGKEGQKLLQKTVQECAVNIASLTTKISNIDSNLSNIQSELNEINANNEEIDQNTYTTILNTIESLKAEKENLLVIKNDKLNKNPEYDKLNEISKSDIDIIKSFIEDLTEIRNKITSLVDSSYLKDNQFIESSNEKIIQLKETYEQNLDKIETDIMSVSNKIYLLKNSDMSYLLKYRPKDCNRECPIISELMKYMNPEIEIANIQKSLEKLMFEKEDLNNKIIKIKEESHNMALALDYINEMNNKIFNRRNLISTMPKFVTDSFSNPDMCYIINILPILADKIEDYKEYVYLNDKINIIDQTITNSNNTLNSIKEKQAINEKWNKLRINFEELSKQRQLLINNLNENETTEAKLKDLTEMNEKNIKQVEDYNKKADLLIEEKQMLKELAKNYYLYNSYKEADRIFEINVYQTKSQLDELKGKIEIIKNKKNSMTTLIENRDSLLKKKKKYDLLAEAWSPKTGYPAIQMEDWLDELTVQTNADLEKMWGSELKIDEFEVGANEFNIKINKNGSKIRDASECSAGEKSTLSLAISFAVIEINLKYKKYNILRFDELDGPFDSDRRKTFIDVLDKRLPDLDCGSAFIISHNNEFGDIPADVILLSETDEKTEMINKTIVYNKGQ